MSSQQRFFWDVSKPTTSGLKRMKKRFSKATRTSKDANPGRPLAIAARLRQGKRSRRAVVEAASRLYQEQPLLGRNDSRTAALIEDMNWKLCASVTAPILERMRLPSTCAPLDATAVWENFIEFPNVG